VGKGKRISDISEDDPSVYTCRQLHEMLRCRTGAGGGMARRAAAANGGQEVVKLGKELQEGEQWGTCRGVLEQDECVREGDGVRLPGRVVLRA
jgi:hypothetical protein